ncbi:MAG: YdeI/OmpD-associated family protein [Bdellovibrionota bacterium]
MKRLEKFSMFYLEVPPRVIKSLGGKFRIRLVCTLNKKLSFQCGLMALGKGLGYITLAKHRLQALEIAPGGTLSVELRPDPSKFGMTVPKEFSEVLRQDSEGKKRFNKLSPGKQRNMIFFVSGTKNSDLRIERALRIVENLKLLPPGKETVSGIFGKRSSRP